MKMADVEVITGFPLKVNSFEGNLKVSTLRSRYSSDLSVKIC